jgi:hypothetical protein
MPERQQHSTRRAAHLARGSQGGRNDQLDCAAHGNLHAASRFSGKKSERQSGMEDRKGRGG